MLVEARRSRCSRTRCGLNAELRALRAGCTTTTAACRLRQPQPAQPDHHLRPAPGDPTGMISNATAWPSPCTRPCRRRLGLRLAGAAPARRPGAGMAHLVEDGSEHVEPVVRPAPAPQGRRSTSRRPPRCSTRRRRPCARAPSPTDVAVPVAGRRAVRGARRPRRAPRRPAAVAGRTASWARSGPHRGAVTDVVTLIVAPRPNPLVDVSPHAAAVRGGRGRRRGGAAVEAAEARADARRERSAVLFGGSITALRRHAIAALERRQAGKPWDQSERRRVRGDRPSAETTAARCCASTVGCWRKFVNPVRRTGRLPGQGRQPRSSSCWNFSGDLTPG